MSLVEVALYIYRSIEREEITNFRGEYALYRFLFLLVLIGCNQEYDIVNDGKNPNAIVVADTSTPDSGFPPATVDTPYTIDTGDDPELELPTWPEMLVTPEFYDFGELKINCSDEYEATISSVGTEPLIVESWIYNETAGLTMETDIELPLTLAPGEEATIKFIYEEDDLFADRGRLYIDSNDFMGPNPTDFTRWSGRSHRNSGQTTSHRAERARLIFFLSLIILVQWETSKKHWVRILACLSKIF